ncbi:MAG: VTT domain-containing protein [Holosporales bacterium]|jgi:membrane protein DedA with SNARE-associated domain|nr:VTT domain-containing protein [Holosporales bacterium]
MFNSGLVTEFVKDWGYIAVFLGSLVEGEVILLTASAFAAGGYLSIYKIFFIAFFTTIFADQLLFFLGYKTGSDWLIMRVPKLEKARDKVFKLLHKMDIFFIFSFRFIYGIRTISPLIIGSAKIKPSRFVIYNILSGLCWAAAGCFLGYTIADLLSDENFSTFPAIIVVSIIVGIIGIGCFYIVKRKHSE